MVTVQALHMDGTMAAPQRDQMLSWLKEETPGNECRIITNVRVLSEGVDVPSLDSVLFLSARNSQVDVVQSVGRVMRKSEGKNTVTLLFLWLFLPMLNLNMLWMITNATK
jgi:predicted helicase